MTTLTRCACGVHACVQVALEEPGRPLPTPQRCPHARTYAASCPDCGRYWTTSLAQPRVLMPCVACGREIVWIRLHTGELMRCNPALVTAWLTPIARHEARPYLTLVTDDGDTVIGYAPATVTDATARWVTGRILHVETCAHAE